MKCCSRWGSTSEQSLRAPRPPLPPRSFFRGVDRWAGLDRATADYVGMLATVMNAICLQVRQQPGAHAACSAALVLDKQSEAPALFVHCRRTAGNKCLISRAVGIIALVADQPVAASPCSLLSRR